MQLRDTLANSEKNPSLDKKLGRMGPFLANAVPR